MAKLYWRIKKNQKWTWVAATADNTDTWPWIMATEYIQEEE